MADIFGDWREEILTALPGELRIYSTTIPATFRHRSLVQDPFYRSNVASSSGGNAYVPILSYDLAMRVRESGRP